MGSHTLVLDMAVCSPARPVFGAHPITRVNDESWRVVPLRYVRTWPGGVERLEALRCPIADLLAPGDSIILTNCPDHVSKQLEAL